MKVLRLGRTDEDIQLGEPERAAFLNDFHHPHGFANGEARFRDDTRNHWWPWEAVPGRRVRTLTRFLNAAGFMPNATHDGIFGYVTQAAVRLFQEYVRTIDPPPPGQPAIWPDGVVGPATQYHIDRWTASKGRGRWCQADEPTADFLGWIEHLKSVTEDLRHRPTQLLQRIATLPDSDTLPPSEWTVDPAHPQLIGIRHGDVGGDVDDEFVLLLNGRVFAFSGSTDPRGRHDREARLVPGRHRYRFDWHNISRRERIYKAARPAGAGVLVTRDGTLDARPNPTINIHWNGLGISNWSAGCQVISGSFYTNDDGNLIDCTAYCARNDAERGTKRTPDGPRLTMGAYTLLSDLLLCYTPTPPKGKKPTFPYTLLPNEWLGLRAATPAPPLPPPLIP